jgi:FkbM family methyltransferase
MSYISLYVKSLLIGSPCDGMITRLRNFLTRRSCPDDVWEVLLEETRFPVVLQRLLTPTSNCVDVGCHVGSFLNEIIKLAPNGKHTAIEAVPFKANLLKKKFRNVRVLSVAVGAQNATCTFVEDIERSGYSHIMDDRPANSGVRSYQMEMKRLDDLISERVDLIKLDIEGAEIDALKGATNTITTWRPSILFECGPAHDMAKAGRDRLDVYRFLTRQLNYNVFFFADFLFGKNPMTEEEFSKSGIYPFRAFNFLALPR